MMSGGLRERGSWTWLRGMRAAAPVLAVLLSLGAGCVRSPRAIPQDTGAPRAAGARAATGDTTYRVLVGAESEDEVALIEFRPCPASAMGSGGSGAPASRAAGASMPVVDEVPSAQPRGSGRQCGARVARTYIVGLTPADIESPHGVVAAPDGRTFFVTIAHGRPAGFLQKFDVESGRLLEQTELGMFPASLDISPTGTFVYVINFNFEDPEMRPSSLSVVDAESMTEVARTTTCRMPHGSRLGLAGAKHYSGCMMDDLLVEVDARTFKVSRLFQLAPGREGDVPLSTLAALPGAGHDMSHGQPEASQAHGGAPAAMSNVCSPTWAQPSPDGTRVYVTCNRSNEIVEVDAGSWRLVRRWATPAAPYNLAPTPNGRLLVVTQKGPATTTIWRLSDARLLAEVPGTRRVASGVAVTPDSRFAFVTLEGIGGDPGTVDIIDLVSLQKVASVDVGKQAGGVAILP